MGSQNLPLWHVAKIRPNPNHNHIQVASDQEDIKRLKWPLLFLMVQNYNQMFTNGLCKKPHKYSHLCTEKML